MRGQSPDRRSRLVIQAAAGFDAEADFRNYGDRVYDMHHKDKRLDLEDANQYFFAQVIGLRDKDVLYVANAPSVEVNKVLSMFRSAVGAASLATGFGRTAVSIGD